MITSRNVNQKEIRKLFSYNPITGILKWRKTGKGRNKNRIAGCMDTNGYLCVFIYGKKYSVQNVIWCGMYGYWPENVIDHKDRVRHHNWIKNLREVSNQCNQRNRGNSKNNTSGVKGVSFDNVTNKWRPYIKINNKLFRLGSYKEFDNAVCARLAAEQCLGWSGCDSNSPAFQYVKDFIQ